jgi:hypothetical protein
LLSELLKVDQISLSNCTVKGSISEMSEEILDYVAVKIKASPYFALQLDDSADVDCCEQLLVYARCTRSDSQPLTATAREAALFRTLHHFLAGTGLQWTKAVDMCAVDLVSHVKGRT